MHIVPYLGSGPVEPPSGHMNILMVIGFCQYDFATCARRFLRNHKPLFNESLYKCSTLVGVDAHCALYQILPYGAIWWQNESADDH